jgi:hypothetical protein
MTDISTYMSLTLARLCGEWQLVSGNYKARGASGGKYEAQIVIFRILAAVNRFSWISWKAESRWGKSESRWRNWKAIEESGKPLKKVESCWRKYNFVWGKSDFRRRKIPIFPKRFSTFWQFWGLVFDTRFATMCTHGFTLLNSSTHNLK